MVIAATSCHPPLSRVVGIGFEAPAQGLMTEISGEKRLAFIEFLMHLPRPWYVWFGLREVSTSHPQNLTQLEYGFGYYIIRSPYTPYSIYLRGTRTLDFSAKSMPQPPSLCVPYPFPQSRQAKEYKSCLNDLPLGCCEQCRRDAMPPPPNMHPHAPPNTELMRPRKPL